MGRSPRGGEAKGDGRGGNWGIDQAQAGLRGASGWRLLATPHILVLFIVVIRAQAVFWTAATLVLPSATTPQSTGRWLAKT